MIGYDLLGTVRFLFPNVLSEPPSKFKVGFPDSYEDGKVVDASRTRTSGSSARRGRIIYALSTTCTHLGCTPNWLEREQKFKCPCHGSGFYITGINFEGPAPGRWSAGPSASATTARLSSTRARNSSKNAASGPSGIVHQGVITVRWHQGSSNAPDPYA